MNTITQHMASIVSSIRDANELARGHMENISKIQKILEETLVLAGELEEDVKSR